MKTSDSLPRISAIPVKGLQVARDLAQLSLLHTGMRVSKLLPLNPA